MRVVHTACPECRKLGKDRKGDNLAIYPDGGKFCFSCGWNEKSSKYVPPKEPKSTRSTFPQTKLPPNAVKYFENFLTEKEIDAHFTFDAELGRSVLIDTLPGFYWGRDTQGYMKTKVFTSGEVPFHVFGGSGDTLVIVEDPISALVVSRSYPCVALFGSYFPPSWFPHLGKTGAKNIVIWLDSDKKQESLKLALTLRHLFNTRYAVSTNDPKMYDREMVELFVSGDIHEIITDPVEA